LTSRLNRVPKTCVRAFLIMRFLVQIQAVGGDVVPHRVGDPIPNRLAGAHPAPDLGRRDLYLRNSNGLEVLRWAGVVFRWPGEHHHPG